MPMKTTNIHLADEDREALRLIREEYNLRSDAAAIRYAVALLARRIRQERNGPDEAATDR